MPPISKGKSNEANDRSGDIELGDGWDLNTSIRMAVYGRSGTGKTWFWSTFPKPILVGVCNSGSKPGELRSINTPENRKVIHPKIIQNSETFERLIKNSKDYATLVIDHVSGLQDVVLREVLGTDKLPAQYTFGMATQETWGEAIGRCKQILRDMLNLPCHIVIVAHERNFNDNNSSDMIDPFVGPAVSPKLSGWINGEVDYIGNTFIRQREIVRRKRYKRKDGTIAVKEDREKVPDKVDYCMRTGANAVYSTKFRTPYGAQSLPLFIVNPTFDKVVDVINGTYGKAKPQDTPGSKTPGLKT